jgi:hypothetical protein
MGCELELPTGLGHSLISTSLATMNQMIEDEGHKGR